MTKTAYGNEDKDTNNDDDDKQGITNKKGAPDAEEKQGSELNAARANAEAISANNVVTEEQFEKSKFETGDHGDAVGKKNRKDDMHPKNRDDLKCAQIVLPSNETGRIPTPAVLNSSFTNDRTSSFETCSMRHSSQQQEAEPSLTRPSSGGSSSTEKQERTRSNDVNQNQPQPGAYAVPGRGGGELPMALRSRLVARGSTTDRLSMLWDSTQQIMHRFSYFNRNSVHRQSPDEVAEGGEDVLEERHRTRAVDCVTVSIVDDDMLNSNLRQEIIAESTQAQNIVLVDDDEEKAKQVRCMCYWALTLCIVLSTVIGLSIGLTNGNESAMTTSEYPSISPTLVSTRTMIPTLDTIQNNGKVRCGIGLIINAEKDLCRALAAAVLGDPDKIDVMNQSLTSRWEALVNGSIDVLTLPSAYTMDRDVYQKDTKAGFTFSTPILYDGIVFGGIPEYVDCANRLDTYFGNCSKVRICVHMGTSFHDALADNLADLTLRPFKTDAVIEMFIKGKCNVLAGPSNIISESNLKQEGYAGEYEVGKTIFLSDQLSMVTREDDKKWSDFVNWVFKSLLAAEEQNITNANASKFMTTTVFGDKYKDMFVNAIEAVGNYGDLYRKHIEDMIPRDELQLNLPNNGSTGLHFAYPLGKPTESPDPIAGSTIHSITKEQGKLRCGIFDRVGFGKEIVSTKGTRWEGMDADYCYALSACLFKGQTNKVAFVNLTASVDGFQALESGLVDVVAGVPLTIEGDVNETSTGKGYTFSLPYFYGGINGPYNISETPEGALSLVTREDDSQWSDFVFWTVSATFIAEEKYITQKMSDDMDGIYVFGPSFVEMYRHAIRAVGNYGEIYSRHVESIEARQGRNLLNTNPFGPQQVSFF